MTSFSLNQEPHSFPYMRWKPAIEGRGKCNTKLIERVWPSEGLGEVQVVPLRSCTILDKLHNLTSQLMLSAQCLTHSRPLINEKMKGVVQTTQDSTCVFSARHLMHYTDKWLLLLLTSLLQLLLDPWEWTDHFHRATKTEFELLIYASNFFLLCRFAQLEAQPLEPKTKLLWSPCVVCVCLCLNVLGDARLSMDGKACTSSHTAQVH